MNKNLISSGRQQFSQKMRPFAKSKNLKGIFHENADMFPKVN